MRVSGEAARQIQREGGAVHFAAGGEEFLVVGFDFRRAGPVGAGVMEQRGAGFIGEVTKINAENAAPR